jgi:hypothetical protein
MRSHHKRGLLAIPLAGALFLAACGGDDGGSAATTTTAASGGSTTTAAGGSTGGARDVNLKGVCPDTVVIQTDWNPEAEHGALYQMVGANPKVDTSKKTVTGPLVASGGQDTGVQIEIRVGGPAIGFQQVTSQMYQDRDILLGYTATDEAVQNAVEQPTKAIVAPLDINPQIVMWDPGTYPDVQKIADLKAKGAKIRYFEGGAYMEYLVGAGLVDKSQLDASYDGTPAVFVSQQGKVAQQGFASAEPYIYKNEVKEWAKDVKFELIHDTGWQPYAAPLGVRADAFEENKACFAKLVPIVQQAMVDYIRSPEKANALIVDLVEQYDTGWVYSAGVADFSVEQMKELELVGNGPDDTLGNFDLQRVDDFIAKAGPIFKAGGKGVKEDLKASDLVTNEFIDPSIKL